MTLDDRGRQAADDAQAAAATTDFAALRARVGAAVHGDPGRRRRSGAALAVAAALLLVGLGIGVLVSGHLTTRNSASSASRAPVGAARGAGRDSYAAARTTSSAGRTASAGSAASADAGSTFGLSAQSAAKDFDRRVVGAPTTGLVAGQSVTLRGFGFAQGSPFVVHQCVQAVAAPGAAAIAACDELPGSPVRAGSAGSAAAYVVVRVERFVGGAGSADCAERPGRCVLVVATRDQPSHAGAVALTFAPVGTTTTP